MSDELQYAFIDESGTVSASKGTRFFVLAAVCARRPRSLELPIRRALKKYGPALTTGEIKAADFKESLILRLLQSLVRDELSILSVIVDQKAILHPPKESEEIYRFAIAHLIYHLVTRWSWIEISLDRRYTSVHQRYLLEKFIREAIIGLSQQFVLIRQENSIERKELQAADVIAWALFQKYERGDLRFYNVIAPHVVLEELVVKKDWRVENKKAAHPGP